MRLLVIGGGRFVGRAIVEAALRDGHAVTTFNRGSQPAPAGVQALLGDRRHGLGALGAAGPWDAVIDCCGYLPDEVAAMAQALSGRCARYVFISSVSAYADHALPRSEDAPLAAWPALPADEAALYGPRKAACEQVLAQHWPGALSLRPTLVVGPHDPTGRFTWWPARADRAVPGEPMLWPGEPSRPLQWIDARDLADFALRAAAADWSGALNVGAPAGQLCWGDLARACAEATAGRAQARWIDQATLLAAAVQPWTELPLWLPHAPGPSAAFLQVDCQRATRLGLRVRPVLETVVDTLAWWRQVRQGSSWPWPTGLSAAREQALLGA